MDQMFDEDQDIARLRRHRAGLARSHLGVSKVLALVASAKRRKQAGAMVYRLPAGGPSGPVEPEIGTKQRLGDLVDATIDDETAH